MNKQKHLLQIYLLGFEHQQEDIYDYDNYFSTVEDRAYELGRSHCIQGRFGISAEEIIKEIENGNKV